ncbi:hypothetical protein GBAR_LOCUS30553 [Geodia barretti]|uniref:Uncharacterized protein n=1 Tax=Geodia barretti TaxID=519541 RepID=A0AA35TYA0_GEOBA|nr:hypothetical protein GBAR_LOCUS30553 [Geodia barretti]
MEYRVFSETDFNSTIGAGGTLGIEKLVNLSLSHKRTSRRFRKASDVFKSGRLRLKRSLFHYMEEQGDTSSGPFLVAFGSERSLRYWTVNENYEIYGTSNPQNASLFFIISSDSGQHPHEFHIAYKGDNRHVLKKRVSSLTPFSQRTVEAIPRYLDAVVSIFGSNPGPLQLVYHVSERSRLLLYRRIANEKGPISLSTWTQGDDVFFINCARRSMKRDGSRAGNRRDGPEAVGANKSAFQVRRISAKSVLATEEGGSLQSYDREVWSSVTLRANLKASVVVPAPSQAPVEIGADSDLSRSTTSGRRTLGKKVINRSVSFMSDHDDKSADDGDDKKPESDGGGDRPFADSVANAHFALPPFEERLSKWIVDKIVQDKGAKLDCNLEDFISKSNEKEKRLILLLCDQFVKHFKITHYVSTIELGALEYSVFSETEFNSSIGGGGVLGVEKIATLSVSGNRSSHRFRKASEVKMIGKISDVKKIPYLQVALQWSLNNYIDEQRDISTGPFLVAFGTGDQERYWKVDGNYGIIAIIHIAYMGDNGASRKLGAMTQKTIPRYLDADVSLFGTNSGPLRLVYHVSERSRLLLFGRVANEKGPINPTMWAQGDDMFFINCARRRMKRDGYIGMRQRRRDQWVSACFPRRGAHNEQNKFMVSVFSLCHLNLTLGQGQQF